jgi:hypothetical protein
MKIKNKKNATNYKPFLFIFRYLVLLVVMYNFLTDIFSDTFIYMQFENLKIL